MWRNAGYENKLVWILIILVVMVIALAALWLYQSNLVTFGLKHSNTRNCSDGSVNSPDMVQSNQNFADGKCAGPSPTN